MIFLQKVSDSNKKIYNITNTIFYTTVHTTSRRGVGGWVGGYDKRYRAQFLIRSKYLQRTKNGTATSRRAMEQLKPFGTSVKSFIYVNSGSWDMSPMLSIGYDTTTRR